MFDELEDLPQEVRAQIQARLDALEVKVRQQPTSLILETIREVGSSSSGSDQDTMTLAVLFKVYAERDGQAAADQLLESLTNS
ncbi:hypothetical protein [Pseudomonas sp. NPDC096950]|uniref:hypothetical protein n=1 Tax=Pseudomonas sp. NPDC096950 TaxID=3364485 RepID=UPI00383AC34C